MSVQHLQDELVQDVLTTAGTLRDLCGAKQEATSGSNELFREIDGETTKKKAANTKTREWEARLRTKMLRFKEISSTVFFLSFEHALSSLNKLSLRKMCSLILANLTISPYNPAVSLRRYLLICTLKPLAKLMFFLLLFFLRFISKRSEMTDRPRDSRTRHYVTVVSARLRPSLSEVLNWEPRLQQQQLNNISLRFD